MFPSRAGLLPSGQVRRPALAWSTSLRLRSDFCSLPKFLFLRCDLQPCRDSSFAATGGEAPAGTCSPSLPHVSTTFRQSTREKYFKVDLKIGGSFFFLFLFSLFSHFFIFCHFSFFSFCHFFIFCHFCHFCHFFYFFHFCHFSHFSHFLHFLHFLTFLHCQGFLSFPSLCVISV